ncbi:MAG: hypothetical protein Q9212_000711 [Teloschistes hypoglaucus]
MSTPAPSEKPRAEREASDEEDVEATFLTTDTSFFDKPAAAKKTSKYGAPASSSSRPSSGPNRRGANPSTSTRGGRGDGRGGTSPYALYTQEKKPYYKTSKTS